MKKFSGNKKSYSKKDFGKKSVRDSEKSPMHRATCDHCGRDCEVPFKPSTGKPIYCSSCFDKHQNKDQKKFGSDRADRKFSGGESRKRGNDSDPLRKEIAQLNKKLDKILEILNNELYNEAYDDIEGDYIPERERKTKKRTSKKNNL